MVNAERRPRAVLLVANAAAPYSRGLRVARSLAAAGYEVEIAAVDDGTQPVDESDGGIRTRRYRPTGIWARFAHGSRPGGGPLRQLTRWVEAAIKLAVWPVHIRGWWAALETELAPADLYHAFGILTIPVALRLATTARDAGRGGIVVYDVIDVILESNNVDRVPSPVLATYRWRERRWVNASDAIVTVNQPIADHLRRRWRLGSAPVVLLNCQPRWDPPDQPEDLIRHAAKLPPDRAVVLFLGRLGRERGLEVAAEAALRMPDAALVLMGFGPWAEELRRRDDDPRYAGRHVTLTAVPPDDVTRWAAGADVSIVAVPANSLNQRLSTPNKFWESIAAGTPVVIGRDLEVMRDIVETENIGVIADPADAGDLARAISEIIDAQPDARRAMRERCIRLCTERYNWELAVEPYVTLVSRLVPTPAAAD
jgi:glycosyltransferase involved in cell wall biosynthesis